MDYRLFYCTKGWDYPHLFAPYAAWVIAEWQPGVLGGIWYKIDATSTAAHAYTKLQVYQEQRSTTED